VACDLAELLGSAIALQLLFGIPLAWVCIMAIDVVVLLLCKREDFTPNPGDLSGGDHRLCFAAEMLFSRPDMGGVPGVCAEGRDFIKPRHALHRHRHSWCYGDAPQPYLHSSIVQTRDWEPGEKVGSDYV